MNQVRSGRKQGRALISSGYKKGQVQDFIVASVWIFVILIGMIVGIKLLGSINSEIQSSDLLSEQGKESIDDVNTAFPTIMDASFLLLFGVIVLFLFISVFFVDSHPVFFIITLPLFLAVTLINAFLVNMIIDLGNTNALAATFAQMPITNFLAGNWLSIIVFVGFSVMVIFFGKRSAVGSQ